MQKLFNRSSLLLVFISLVAVIAVSQMLFKGVRLDLTENRIYSLSDGTRNLLEAIDEPIQLYFFYSRDAAQGLPPLQTWAQQVQEFLEEITLAADGKLKLSVINPEPFSEDEDRAATLGIQPVPLGGGTEELYFGLAATNSVEDVDTIPFFQLNRQAQLEYDVAKLIYGLANPDKQQIGLMSTLPVNGGFDPATRAPRQPWMSVSQLNEFFSVETVATDATVIPESLDLLILIHPVKLPETTLYALDQFVLRGGRLLAFVDPLSQIAGPMSMNPANEGPGPASELEPLLSNWGVSLSGEIVGDAAAALQVNGPEGRPVYHLAMLGYDQRNLNADDVITQDVESVNLGVAGFLSPVENATTTVMPLITSSDQAAAIPAFRVQPGMNPASLASGFAPSGETYTVAARISGPARSAYGDTAPPAGETGSEHRAEGEIQVVVVADTDLLADQFWVQVSNFLGQRIASPFAGNGDLLLNAADNLLGSADIISIKSRAGFNRPFTLIEQMKRDADRQFRDKEEELQDRLRETERKLSELQTQKQEGNVLTLSPEQEAEVERFLETKLATRKELRAVRFNLNKDVERLEGWLKFLNIAGVPLLLILGALLVSRKRQRQEVVIV
ncbi:MAG: Gldg family protein [Oceanococcaceae bacterium]